MKYENLKKYWLIITVVLASCEKKSDFALETQQDNRIVVDGMITNEKKAHIISLSLPVMELNALPSPVSGASVTVTDGFKIFIFNEKPQGSGIYQTDSNTAALMGRKYTLNISYDGNNFSATDTMVGIDDYNPFVIKHVKDSLYELKAINKPFAEDPALWHVWLDWSDIPGFTASDSLLTHAKLAFYNFNSIDVSQVFSPQKESVLFPKGTIMTINKFTLSPAYSEFLRALVFETEWRGGFFDAPAANIPTNLSSGAMGFFAACAVTTDTVIVIP